jgi:hypothetical protein
MKLLTKLSTVLKQNSWTAGKEHIFAAFHYTRLLSTTNCKQMMNDLRCCKWSGQWKYFFHFFFELILTIQEWIKAIRP